MSYTVCTELSVQILTFIHNLLLNNDISNFVKLLFAQVNGNLIVR